MLKLIKESYSWMSCLWPLQIALLVLIFFFLIPAMIFASLETNWGYLDALYYCFISLTTIGLGDFIPGDTPDQAMRPLYKACTTCTDPIACIQRVSFDGQNQLFQSTFSSESRPWCSPFRSSTTFQAATWSSSSCCQLIAVERETAWMDPDLEGLEVRPKQLTNEFTCKQLPRPGDPSTHNNLMNPKWVDSKKALSRFILTNSMYLGSTRRTYPSGQGSFPTWWWLKISIPGWKDKICQGQGKQK